MERRLGAALDAELPQDARDVDLDRLLFHEQLTGYLPVRLAAGQELQDLGLTLGERLRVLGGTHLAHQTRRRLGGELDPPLGRAPYRPVQFLGVGVLEQIAYRPGAHGPCHRGTLEDAGERHDFHLRQLCPDRLGGRDPIHDGHEKVHQDHVGLELPGHLQGLLAVLGLSHDLDIRVEREKHPQALAHHAVVVGYQDPYRHYLSYDFGPRLSPRRRSMAMFVPLPDGPVSTFAIASKTGDPPRSSCGGSLAAIVTDYLSRELEPPTTSRFA